MSEVKESAIKLFGKTIPLSAVNHQKRQPLFLATHTSTESSSLNNDCCDPSIQNSFPQDNSHVYQQQDKENSRKGFIDDKQKDDSQQIAEDQKDPTTSSGISDNPKTPSVDRETSSLKSSMNGEQSETSNSQEKTVKKPDRILPCPRCNSMDTKFCYYNNYNVNQPRHFCKNCQRYWTAGGTMRNVPIGAGRRKNKGSSASHYRQIIISEALRTVQANGVHNPPYGNNGTVLNFGSDSPLFESVASVLNLSDKTQNGVRNGFHGSEQGILVSREGTDNGDDHSNGSSITALSSSEKGVNCGLQEPGIKNYQGSAPQVPYFPGPPWPFPWNSPMPPPALCPPGFPVSFYPETYWGCTIPGHWNMPCLSPTYSSLSQSAPNSSPTTSTLGKHSRDGNNISPAISDKEEPSRGVKNSERSVLVPKTLRFDDPSEAAKSSIWATLGITSEKTNTGESLFKGFQSKSDDKNYIAETSAVLQANPAAFSRSLNFHEST
ncbi:hypothetical protein ACOSQ2_018339 [Xanthoceras sorbifolium]|uniref:Dof-type domain-containing protein n=1 Tax=Xanthoceras sorbifolium TaxID=99658 RepID=A0ABQ8I0Y2_9ROSI|nr:hypothetical protein JRO89_XS05G0042600 [Xanthoceras sorbifolium]